MLALVVELGPQCLAGARQARHDRSHWNIQRRGQLLIGQSLKLAQDEQLAETGWQPVHRSLDQHYGVGLKQQRFGVRCGLQAAVLLLVERVRQFLYARTAPAGADIADDGEKPRASVSTGERPKVTKGAKRCFLHHVFRVVLVPNEPARQPSRRVEVGQNRVLEGVTGTNLRRSTTVVPIHASLRALPESPTRASGIRSGSRFRAGGCSRRRRRCGRDRPLLVLRSEGSPRPVRTSTEVADSRGARTFRRTLTTESRRG